MYYIIDINRPCIFFSRDDCLKEILRRGKRPEWEDYYKHQNFHRIVNGIYVYTFGKTTAAKAATSHDFPTPIVVSTETILPRSGTAYVSIDLDIGLVPRKKIRLMKTDRNNLLRKVKEATEANDLTALRAILDDENSDDDDSADDEYFDNPNEDDVSKCVKHQVKKCAAKLGLKVTVNKGRVEPNVGILILTKYAKSRPDTMILRLAIISEEEVPPCHTPNGASTEHKEKLTGDHVGQTLAGAEKVCGEVTKQFLEEYRVPLYSCEIFSLLVDYSTSKAEVFKVCLDFSSRDSKIYRGKEPLEVTDAFNRLLHQLVVT